MGNNSIFAKIMIYFGFFMVILYIGLGLFLIISPTFDYIPSTMKNVFAIFFIVYGIFRLVRLIMKLKELRNYE